MSRPWGVERVTWVVHHPTRSIHRMVPHRLLEHVGRMTMAEVAVVARCSAGEMEKRFPGYTTCGQCCPGTAPAGDRATVGGAPVLMG